MVAMVGPSKQTATATKRIGLLSVCVAVQQQQQQPPKQQQQTTATTSATAKNERQE